MDINDLSHFDDVPKPAYHNAYSLLRLFLVIVFYMIVFGLAAGIPLFIFKAYHLQYPLLKPFLKFIGYISAMLISLRYAIRKSKQQEGGYFKINFDKAPTWLFPVIIISTWALVVLLLVLLLGVYQLIPNHAFVQKHLTKAFTTDIFTIVTTVIAAPLLEEILCRGIVLRGLLKSYPAHKAILISALFFAALHINPLQAFPAFFGGLFTGWVYYKTRSVIPGMVIHATINGTVMALLFFLYNVKSTSGSALAMPYYIILCLVSALIFSAGCIIIQKNIPSLAPEQTI